MKSSFSKIRVGIVGCGAIGSRMAQSIQKDFSKYCHVTGLFDILPEKSLKLAQKLNQPRLFKKSLNELLSACDFMVEATNAPDIHDLVHSALSKKKSALVMSIGKLLHSEDLFRLAKKNKCYLLLPSGAIAGIDAIKAASLVGIEKITLTTRKPPQGFQENVYLIKKGIDLSKIKEETVLYEGNVANAVKNFPQNINVAATVALACQANGAMKIKIITSPEFKRNSHEIEMSGDFGRIFTRTDNAVCPDNPKTSYLAVLSGLQTLKQYCTGVLIGT